MGPGPRGPRVRVLLVDDHPMVRVGLRSMLTCDTIDVVGEAGTGADAIRAVDTLAPELVLLDIELPDIDGFGVLADLRRRAPAVPVLIVSMHDDPRLVGRALAAGAAGWILKGASRRELLRAVADAAAAPTIPSALVVADPLTPVEREVLMLIADGLTNREIAERLRWSVATVKKYVQRVLDKLEVSDRTQAAVVGVRRGLLR